MAAAHKEDQTSDVDLTPLLSYHLAPADEVDQTSFLAKLSLSDHENTQRILVNTKSTIVGYQPEKVPMPCLYEAVVYETVKRKGVDHLVAVKRKCTNYACSTLPVCPMHLHMLDNLGRHDKYTPGN